MKLYRETELLALWAGVGSMCFGASAVTAKKPNIVLIVADDASAKEFSIYGGQGIHTPNLDRMAKEGVAFKTAWAAPQCAPTRAMLHTGNYACKTGWYGNEIPGSDFSKRDHLMGKMMQKAGYKTAFYEKFHFSSLCPDPAPFGFDEYAVALPWEGYTGSPQDRSGELYRVQWFWHPGIVCNGKGIPVADGDFGPDIHVGYITDFIKRHRDTPFFVYWPTFLPHKEFNNNQWSYTSVPELDGNGIKTGQRVPGSLTSTLEYLDHLLGQILGSIREQGLENDTIVIFTADNGTAPYGKNKFEDERGPRVPFVVWGPGFIKPQPLSDVLIDFTDIAPTLVELGGGKIPDGADLDGHSFAPYLLGQPFKERECIFCQFYDGQWVRDRRFLRDGRGNYYDCGDSRDEAKGYRKMTMTTDPELLPEMKRRFQKVLDCYPVPDTAAEPSQNLWKRYFKTNKPALLPENKQSSFS